MRTFYVSVAYIWYDDRFTQMKRSNAHEVTPSSSEDVVHVFMSSFSETADAEVTSEHHTLQYVWMSVPHVCVIH